METKLVFQMELNGWRSEISDFLFAIPEGWVVSGTLALPPDAKFTGKKIIWNAGYLYSRHFPFPMIVSKSESQKDRDNDLGMLTSRTVLGDLGSERGMKWLASVPGFIEWDEYGIGNAVSFLSTKIAIGDWFKNGYEGTIIAARYVDQKIGEKKFAEATFDLHYDMRQIRITLDFFPQDGSVEELLPIIGELRRNHWKQIESVLS